MITLQLTGEIPADLTCTITELGEHIAAPAEAAFINWLHARGYSCERALEWESPSELAERLFISPSHVSQALKHPLCPKPHDIIRTGSGRRISYIRSTPKLDAFLTKHVNKN